MEIHISYIQYIYIYILYRERKRDIKREIERARERCSDKKREAARERERERERKTRPSFWSVDAAVVYGHGYLPDASGNDTGLPAGGGFPCSLPGEYDQVAVRCLQAHRTDGYSNYFGLRTL